MRLPLSSRLSRRTTGRRDKDSALMSGGRLDEDCPAIDAVNIIKAVAFSAIRMAVIIVVACAERHHENRSRVRQFEMSTLRCVGPKGIEENDVDARVDATSAAVGRRGPFVMFDRAPSPALGRSESKM